MSNYVLVMIVGAAGIGLMVGFVLGSIERRHLFGPLRTEQIATTHKAPTDQRWFWTGEWQEGEREASVAIATGQTTQYDSEAAFLAALDATDAKA